MNKAMKEEIVIDVFLQAWGKENPSSGLVIHTDQGSQHTVKAFRNIVESYCDILSYSRKGNPYDNAIMASIYRTLQRELINDAQYENREQDQLSVFFLDISNNLKSILMNFFCL